MRIFLKIDKVVDKIQEYACFLLFFAMVVVGGISVFSRFIFNMSITWAEETIKFLCIWLTFVGAALTVRKDGHVSIDIFVSLIKNDKIRAIYYCISRLIGIAFLCVLLPAAIELVQLTGNSMAASIKISWKYIYLAVPVGIVNMLWAYITALPHYTKKQYEEKVETLLDNLEDDESVEDSTGDTSADEEGENK